MDFLARKISRAKWMVKPYLAEGEISADAISGCLRTQGDRLSWWRCSEAGPDIADVALALACRMDRLEAIDLVLLRVSDVKRTAIDLETTPGDTPVQDLRNSHVDVINLDTTRLCTIATLISREVRTGSGVFRFTKRRLTELVARAFEQKRISIVELSTHLQAILEREV